MRNLLNIDPDKLTRELIKLGASSSGYMVHSALHGGEALEIIENHTFDCVIVDLNTPHVSGLELINLLQRDNPRPWIIATFHQNESHEDYPWREIAVSAGADEVLAKPFSLEQLLDRISASKFEAQHEEVGIRAVE